MFKDKTIQSLMQKAIELKKRYLSMDPEDIPICISDGNQKIGRVMNVSLMPIMTCANCRECKRLCYDIKACNQYKNVLDARIRNTVLLELDRDLFFDRIDEKISRRRLHKFFRWHVAGDIVDLDYFSRMVEIAEKHTDFIFWTYTKNYNVINQYVETIGAVPANLKIMFSEWRGMPMANPHGFPEFKVVFKGETKPDGFYCPGNCDVCKASDRGCIKGETTYCMEH